MNQLLQCNDPSAARASARASDSGRHMDSFSTVFRYQAQAACGTAHTPSIAFRHLPPNSARFSYATEEAFFISAQLSSDAVSALRKVRVLIGL